MEDSKYQPEAPGSLRALDNRPVVRVTWYEALEYCNWLTEKLRKWERTPEPLAHLLRDEGWIVTLPSEAQWEKAARGHKDRREYPWGEKFDPKKVNMAIGDEKVEGTSPVGIYPGGASPYGVMDLSGNVWEWCSSLYQDYPYDPDDGREDLEAAGRRVLRGGSWIRYGERRARCSARLGLPPSYFVPYLGLRVVVEFAYSLRRF